MSIKSIARERVAMWRREVSERSNPDSRFDRGDPIEARGRQEEAEFFLRLLESDGQKTVTVDDGSVRALLDFVSGGQRAQAAADRIVAESGTYPHVHVCSAKCAEPGEHAGPGPLK